MADFLTVAERSRLMSKIKGKGNRSTELRMVALLRASAITGWRRHLGLPGNPDFTFRREKVCVFVDGCFWHGCPACYRAPESNGAFWRAKVENNRARDSRTSKALRKRGYWVVRIWECDLGKPAALGKVKRALTVRRR